MALTENVYSKYSKLMNNPPSPVHEDQSATANDCSESTISQPPLKRFHLLVIGTGHDGTFFCCSGRRSLCQILWTLN